MTDEHRIRGIGDQFRDAPRPDPIYGIGWLGHARGLYAIVGAQILPEHRFPIDLPGPTSRLTSTVNHQDSLRLRLGSDHRPQAWASSDGRLRTLRATAQRRGVRALVISAVAQDPTVDRPIICIAQGRFEVDL